MSRDSFLPRPTARTAPSIYPYLPGDTVPIGTRRARFAWGGVVVHVSRIGADAARVAVMDELRNSVLVIGPDRLATWVEQVAPLLALDRPRGADGEMRIRTPWLVDGERAIALARDVGGEEPSVELLATEQLADGAPSGRTVTARLTMAETRALLGALLRASV